MSAVPRPTSLVPARLTRRFGHTRAAVVTLLGVLGALSALGLAGRAAVAAVTALMVDPTWPPADAHMYGPHVVSATSGGQVWYEDRFSAKVLSGVTYHVKVRNPGLTGGTAVPNFSVKLNGVYYATKDSLTNGATEFTKQVPLQTWNKIELWIAAGSGQVSLEIYSQAGTSSVFANVGGVKEVRPQAGLDTVNTVWQVTLPAGAGPTHVLAIDNGALDRSGRVGCCEWGEVKLNGTRVFWLDTLYKQQSKVMVPITLQPGTNTLQVIADSLINGAHMFVRVMQAGGSAPPPSSPDNWPPHDEPLYGPHTVAAQSSGQVWYEDKFSAKLLGGGDKYFVFVRTPSLLGGTAVPNFSVKLNGVYYATKDSLKNGATEFVKQVPVAAWNRIELWIAPGSGKIDLEVYRERMAFRTLGPAKRIEPAAGQTTVTTTWQVTKPANAGPSHLIVLDNGDYDRTKRVGPNEYGKVRLNGSIVFDVDTFHSNTTRAAVPVTLQSGVNTIEVTAGNMGEVGEHFYVRAMYADTAKPVVTVTQPAANPAVVNTSSVTLSGTYQDSVWGRVLVGSASSFTTVIMSGNGGLKTWSATRTLSVEGANTIKVWGRDAAFNTSDTLVRTIIRDTQQPTLAVSAPAEGFSTNQSSVTVTASASDANGVTVTANGVTLAAQGGGTYSGSVPLNVGANRITVVATDGGGNTRSVVRNVTRTAAPLAVVINSPAANAITNANAVTVSGVASGGTAPYTVSANGTSLPVNASDGTYSGSVPLTTEGAITITVTATDAASATKSEVVNITRDATAPALVVTQPAEGAATSEASLQVSGTVSDPRLSSLTLDENAVTVNPDNTFSTSVALALGSNTLRFVARDAAENVTTVTRIVMRNVGVNVVVQGRNAGASVERDACLTIAASDGAAYECGDLRLAHELPTTRTMNKVRAPTLVFSSRHADPSVLIAADVSVEPQYSVTQLRAAISVNGGQFTVLRTVDWDPTWSNGTRRRIVTRLRAVDVGLTTGAYSYTLRYEGLSGGGVVASGAATGTLVIVDRSLSPFGFGWWLAGLEQLSDVVPSTNQKLWIAGDGSSRLYVHRTDTTWTVAELLDRPDTLVSTTLANGRPGFRRLLPGGGFVEFDAGAHVATQNRLGHRTSFVQTNGALREIRLPTPPGSTETRTYVFNYTEVAGQVPLLSSVDAPTRPLESRRTVLMPITGTRRVEVITDPDIRAVTFRYDTQNRVDGRKNRRGHWTYFDYDEAHLLRQVRVDMAFTNEPEIVTKFCPAESRSIAACASGPQRLDSVYTLHDGPRDNVNDKADTTVFYVNRFGGPDTVVNALGHRTRIERDDMFPLLAKVLVRPNDFRTETRYTNRGLPEIVTAKNPLNETPARDAITKYTWHSKWNSVTKIEKPDNNETIHFDYDLLTGNRLWEQPGTDPSRRVEFTYFTGATLHAGTNLLATSKAPGTTAVDSVVYDPGLGNVSHTRTPRKFLSLVIRDFFGRDSVVITPVDTVSARDSAQLVDGGTVQRHTYDVWDQVLESRTTAPANASEMQLLRVVNGYDDEGNLTRVERTTEPNPAGIGSVVNQYQYDAAGRQVAEIAPDNMKDTVAYDPAGNAITRITRRGQQLSMRYDALNRVEQRTLPQVFEPDTSFGNVSWPLYSVNGGLTIPEDVQEFGYDAVGNMVKANNREAQVKRVYNPGGTLAADTLRVRSWNGTDFSHLYGLQYRYDLNGRRKTLIHPEFMAPRAEGVVRDLTEYTYGPDDGLLATVTDPLRNVFTYSHDVAGRLENLLTPAGVYHRFFYDDDDQLVKRVLRKPGQQGTNAQGFPVDTIQSTRFFYDARAKMIRAAGYTDSVDNTYNALGALSMSWRQPFPLNGTNVNQGVTEQIVTDAVGRIASRDDIVADGSFNAWDYIYQSGTGRLLEMRSRSGTNSGGDITTYDRQGNTRTLQRTERTRNSRGEDISILVKTFNYYDADHRLRIVDRRTDAPVGLVPSSYLGTYEEYRYDALGRRVAMYSRRDNSTINTFVGRGSAIERYVWDGDQLLYETHYDPRRSGLEHDTTTIGEERRCGGTGTGGCGGEEWPGPTVGDTIYDSFSGRVVYTHGVGIDQPLSIIRIGYGRDSLLFEPFAVMPVTNWRGSYERGFTSLGGQLWTETHYQPDGIAFQATLDLRTLGWPSPDQRMLLGGAPGRAQAEPQAWFGSLIHGQADQSGLHYKRNRYYDPARGQFTQEDPIGLAGGLNLYGYANGDPVNLSDPFGLSPDCLVLRLPCPVVVRGAAGASAGPLGIFAAAVWSVFRADRNANGEAEMAGEAPPPAAAPDATNVARKPTAGEIADAVGASGATVTPHKTKSGEGTVIKWPDGSVTDIRVESHPLPGSKGHPVPHGNVDHWDPQGNRVRKKHTYR